MIIAIDLDNTWTLDPDFWNGFYNAAQQAGHIVIMATARKTEDNNDFNRWKLPDKMPVVFSSGKFKREACEKAGYKVDVWIDDTPSMVDGGLLLNFDDKEL